MALDTQWFWAFLVVFVRASGLVLVAPVFGTRTVPVPVRVGLCAVIALGVAPLIQAKVGDPPTEWVPLFTRLIAEVLFGLLMGYGVSLIINTAIMAGELLDTMMGFSIMQVMNPLSSFPTSILAQFHYMLAMVLFAVVNGHHLLLVALVRSFELGNELGTLAQWSNASLAIGTRMGGELLLLCVQIAAPAGGVLLVVDSAMAAVSRAVPQVPVWLIGMPAKIAVGLVALGASLPAMVGVTNRMTEMSLRFLENCLRMVGG